jgi:pyruvate,water dikinase
MPESNTNVKKSVYFWEDVSHTKVKESLVGRKGLSLFELKDMDVPIPDFFVVSSSVFDKVISTSLIRDSKELLKGKKNPDEEEVAKSILKTEFSEEVEEEILSGYTRISGFTDAWVSVRSSVVFPSIPELSFSGIFSTELNVRGRKDLLESIKRIYTSMFTDDVVAYASAKGINLADVKLAVVVQRMIQSEVSGVSFTVDPITRDTTKLSIEAVYGLGDTISLGELTPDTYLLNKKDLSVLEKKISPQEWMKIRVLRRSSKNDGTQKVTISNNWSHRQKVEDKYLKEIAKISLIVENKLRKPQSVEWVMSGGRVWVLQSKDLYERYAPDTMKLTNIESFDTLGEVISWCTQRYEGIGMLEEKAVENAQKIVQANKYEKGSLTEKLVNVAKVKVKQKEDLEGKQISEKEDLVVKGIGASFGVVVGKVAIVDKDNIPKISK